MTESEDDPCPHCGEALQWMDMFGILWCSELYWGYRDSDKKENENEL